MIELVGLELLAIDHVLEGFECGDESLDTWLTARALRNQVDRSSRTWVVSAGGRVVAYYASSAAVVLRVEATSALRETSRTRCRQCCSADSPSTSDTRVSGSGRRS